MTEGGPPPPLSPPLPPPHLTPPPGTSVDSRPPRLPPSLQHVAAAHRCLNTALCFISSSPSSPSLPPASLPRSSSSHSHPCSRRPSIPSFSPSLPRSLLPSPLLLNIIPSPTPARSPHSWHDRGSGSPTALAPRLQQHPSRSGWGRVGAGGGGWRRGVGGWGRVGPGVVGWCGGEGWVGAEALMQ